MNSIISLLTLIIIKSITIISQISAWVVECLLINLE
jgi:hypothetical protein